MRPALPALLLVAATPAVAAAPLDPAVPADAIAIARKMQCSATDGEVAVFHWSGRVYSRIDGERDRHIFDVEGMNIRQCGTVTDAARGIGYRMVSREIMLYLDPATRQPLRRWTNPWTSAEVEVVHVANDPVNNGPNFTTGRDGRPYTLPLRVEGGRAFWPVEVPLFYTNPLGGDFQAQVGNQYHAMEIFDFVDDAQTVLDRARAQSRPAIAWVRISPWLPFMEMGSRGGLLVFNAIGQKLARFDDLPAVLKTEIAERYPEYRAPPPLDDARPNETSWTAFKKRRTAR